VPLCYWIVEDQQLVENVYKQFERRFVRGVVRTRQWNFYKAGSLRYGISTYWLATFVKSLTPIVVAAASISKANPDIKLREWIFLPNAGSKFRLKHIKKSAANFTLATTSA